MNKPIILILSLMALYMLFSLGCAPKSTLRMAVQEKAKIPIVAELEASWDGLMGCTVNVPLSDGSVVRFKETDAIRCQLLFSKVLRAQ